MCLAVPGNIVEIRNGILDNLGRLAVIDFQGSKVEASLAMTPQAKLGDWVLVHAGFAITVLDEVEAKETFESLDIALGDESA